MFMMNMNHLMCLVSAVKEKVPCYLAVHPDNASNPVSLQA
jgi:hypothetical protein